MFPIRNAVPTRYPPTVTWALIVVNCAVFLFQISLSPAELKEFLAQFALIPARYTDPFLFGDGPLGADDLIPFVTMMFLHGGWLHLILNMWILWLFGPAIEDRLGHGRYLAFYLVCGIAAAVAHAAFNPTSVVPALGASGAIAGVLGCYIWMFPLSRVIVVVHGKAPSGQRGYKSVPQCLIMRYGSLIRIKGQWTWRQRQRRA